MNINVANQIKSQTEQNNIDITKWTPEQIAKLTPEQVAQITYDVFESLTREQMLAIGDGLTSFQLTSIVRSVRASDLNALCFSWRFNCRLVF